MGDGAPSSKSVRLRVRPGVLQCFHPLLRSGVGLDVRVGIPVRDLLSDELGMRPEYLENRVQTLFLDGKPVDDVDTALVTDGSVLAISAAMPGLAGATLRKSGFFSGLRHQINYHPTIGTGPERRGRVVLKTFNLLTAEIAPWLMTRGVLVEGERLAEVLKDCTDMIAGCRETRVDGKEIPAENLHEAVRGNPYIFLEVHVEG